VHVNPAAAELTGYSMEELKGMSIPDLHEKEDLKAYEEYFDRIMSGEPALTEAKILRKDGTKVSVEFNNSRIEIGGVAYMLSEARDITRRRQAEEALRRSEELFRSVFEHATIGFYRTTPDGRFLMANPAMVRMLGFDSFEELASQNGE